ncbi:hypothetical protein N836_32095 [Leptolyngbya sp. Heron Island J]|uniref:hypothetical protein n=1 Tax=Leptolyngbya sp. Heron Island J TaxID=1385935 RepID=UPI0003B9DF7E|nr:hypothetical protein [Leptolyngbya sp. Heron Island J]ESA38582.1 hypothetical protein N836_32095 [Leptolyngbya sp. Heron Island J]
MKYRPSWNWQATAYTAGLIAIALFTFHAISSLVFSALGLAPSSPQWGLTLTLGGFLAIAGAAVGIQSLQGLPRRLTGMVSGAASLAILGFYSFGQLSEQDTVWAIAGAVVGLFVGGSCGFWTAGKQRVGGSAIALISSLCAYGAAFGVGSWTLAAINTQRWMLAAGLGVLTALYLWCTQRGLLQAYHQWQHELSNRP